MDTTNALVQSQDVAGKVSTLLRKRLDKAAGDYSAAVRTACEKHGTAPDATHLAQMWSEPYRYAVDFAQRSVLFWDTLRQRGNDYIEHSHDGAKPVLKFKYETLVDGRKLARPVNYALLSIIPPAGVTVDPAKRPYVIIDPRAGHGPGIGGFKEESEVGVALAAGHPVYFVMFFQYPEPGQTLLDVCEAEKEFIRVVRERHPGKGKPVVIGNCQGGWAAMMLAAADPEDMGPVILIGAPMSYWGGAWHQEQAPNPMRYAGGLLGGTWGASYSADLGNGVFDGAHLVQNFENLNPAANYWEKYYTLFANADTEPPRFLEFERWWSSYYMMNRDEIEWITRNLFIGNRLWSGEVRQKNGKAFDIRDVKSPIILFASLGDNITPAQQAFNWIADVFRSTEEVKAGGHVIVGLVHENVGHLGIFVSGKVARKETRQLVEVMDAIEMLQPGIYGMEIVEKGDEGGKPAYDVRFREYRLEDIAAKLNPLKREDELPFHAVEAMSQFNQRAYELFARPFVKAAANENSARVLRDLHPLRVRNWALSDAKNPWLSWLAPAAQAVKLRRAALPPDAPSRKAEALGADMVSAVIDYQRAVRDALAEATFFTVYGNAQIVHEAGATAGAGTERAMEDPRHNPVVREALSHITEGGFVEAFSRVAFLLARTDEPIPLSRLTTAQELIRDYADLLPGIPPGEARRIRGQQEIIVRHEPERALETLPALLTEPERKRMLKLIDRVVHDKRVLATRPTPQQAATLERVRAVLRGPTGQRGASAGRVRRTPALPSSARSRPRAARRG